MRTQIPIVSALLLGVVVTAAQATPITLLVDFNNTIGSVPSAQTATASDFAEFDSNVDLATTVAPINTGGFAPDFSAILPATVTGTGISATLDLTGVLNAFAGVSSEPLLTDFFFDFGPVGPIVGTISSIEEIGLGDLVTLTVFAGGSDDEDSVISATQGGVTLGTGVPVPAFALGTGGDPFAQFTFVNNGGDIVFTVEDADGVGNFGVSGFSLTATVIPEPSSALLLSCGGGWSPASALMRAIDSVGTHNLLGTLA